MSLRKSLNYAFMLMLTLAIACGEGKQVVDESELGDDDHAAPAASAAGGDAAAAAPAAAPVAVADAATIGGLVKFEGTAPKMPNLQMGADPFCQSQHTTPAPDEEVMVGPGGELANVIVYVKNAPAGGAPPAPAVLDQRGCKYIPHVSAVQVGQTVQIKNSDATLHNVHAMPTVNAQFNEGQPVQGMVSTKKFDKVEMKPFRIKCDVHGWMKSYMAVLPHSYHNVSQTNGTFSIANLPPGNYTLVAWHEKFGEQEQQVTVGAKEQKQVQFTFKG
ncbi:MAG TPA: carboxypeptidase regulatory-like domain-containing protein [Thermoanaerobaculia bacterium]|jgi:plastocyanin|nr:carboxypeptidase regulatory-like domain-containing protein [Thermoanaerobaculia bacterium]